MKLHIIPGSPNGRKAEATAKHLNVDYEPVLIDLPSGQQRSPEYLALNPNGKTPILEDDGLVLWESNAIMQYIAGGTPLFPDDRKMRADIARWQFWEAAHYHRPVAALMWENFLKQQFGQGDSDAAAVSQATDTFRTCAAVLDGHLAHQPFLIGDALTIADFTVACHSAYIDAAKVPYRDYPNLAAWYERVGEVPAWKATAPTWMQG